jgi:hypothetical protein
VPTPTVPSNFSLSQQTNGRQVSSPSELAEGSRRLRASDASSPTQFSPPTSPNRRRMVSDQMSTHSASSAPIRELPPTVREFDRSSLQACALIRRFMNSLPLPCHENHRSRVLNMPVRQPAQSSRSTGTAALTAQSRPPLCHCRPLGKQVKHRV